MKEEHIVLKMTVELDEEQMIEDGIDVSSKWNEIDHMVNEIEEITQTGKGVFVTDDSGARGWFIELLEETPWFMKYVVSWKIDDGDLQDDVIQGLRDLGMFPC